MVSPRNSLVRQQAAYSDNHKLLSQLQVACSANSLHNNNNQQAVASSDSLKHQHQVVVSSAKPQRSSQLREVAGYSDSNNHSKMRHQEAVDCSRNHQYSELQHKHRLQEE